MFVALSENNLGVKKHLNRFLAFGPVAQASHQTSPLFTTLAKYNVDKWFIKHNVSEFLAYSWIPRKEILPIVRLFPKKAMGLMSAISDLHAELDNYKRMDVIIGHDPAGTSVFNMVHWK